jgi:pimeloyl-ACP methyl ester carboxylesterase
MSERISVHSGGAELIGDVVGAGPPVVCLHAGVADRRVWAGTSALLCAQHRIYTYDRRGFGDTLYEAEAFSHVEDLGAVITATKVAQVIVIGNSLGGKVALDYSLEHADRVAGLILVAPGVSGAPPPEHMAPSVAQLDEAIDAADEAGDGDLVNRLEAHLWLDGADMAEGRVGGANRELFLEMNLGAIQASDPGAEVDAPSAWDRLDTLSVPTLVLFGEYDMEIMRSNARHIAEQASNAQFVGLPGVAHVPMLEDPQAFAAAISPFMASIGAG